MRRVAQLQLGESARVVAAGGNPNRLYQRLRLDAALRQACRVWPPGTEHTVRVKGRLQTNSSEVIRAAVLAGRGIGYSPDCLSEAERASGERVTLMPDWQTPPLSKHLVSPAQRQHSAKVRPFGDFVRAGLN